MADWEEVKKFFLEASAAAHAADTPLDAIPDFPGFEIRRIERGPYRYADCTLNAEDHGLGLRIIWLGGRPIWWMQYDENRLGSDKRVQPFLRRILAETYAKGLFRGGRGPEELIEWPLKYENRPTLNGFGRFAGRDFVTDTDSRRILLSGAYRGKALI